MEPPVPKFLTPLDSRQIDDTHWRLLADLKYLSIVAAHVIVVPKGFVTDYASVPRLPLAYLLAGGRGNAAACLHDFLYQIHLPYAPKSISDDVFREALGALGENAATRWVMYRAVDLFGRRAYVSGPRRFKALNER
jgi:hypothetical protein